MSTVCHPAMLTFDDIAARVLAYNPEADIGLLERAYRFGEEAHQGQTRRSGEPYFSHPVAVVEVLMGWQIDIPTLSAALLHDTVEDTSTRLEDIQGLFGGEVAQLVDGMTKVDAMAGASATDRKATNLSKIVEAMLRDIRVALIKIADRTHNVRTLGAMEPRKQVRIAAETQDIYIPMAMGLGLGKTFTELQERCFEILHPQDFEEIRAIFDYARERVLDRGEALRGELGVRLEGRVAGARVLTGALRPHEVHRIHRRSGQPLERVAHILRIAVITPREEDCYTVLGILHGLRRPILGRFKDYIAEPRSNQYRALHTRVRGEQGCAIRARILSEEMHAVAERGITHQWAYKRGADEAPADFARRMRWLQELQECQQAMLCSNDFLEMVHRTLATDKIHPVTPRGEVMELPRGATVIDFAFAIHSDLGWHCAGATVDGRRVGREHTLSTGDAVEIITDPAVEPVGAWLKHAHTARARYQLRSGLRAMKRERLLAIGRNRLKTALHLEDGGDGDLADHPELARAVHRLGYADVDSFLVDVGYGKVALRGLLTAIDRAPAAADKPAGSMVLSNANTSLYHLANCCRPLAGDDVVGFVSNRDGIIVHRRTCHHAVRRSFDADRVVPVCWQADTVIGGRVGVVVEMRNRQGALAAVCTRISDGEGDIIKSRSLSTSPRYGSIHFEIQVRNLEHLNRLLEALRSDDVVVSAERV